jgi:serine/threonine protein kinase
VLCDFGLSRTTNDKSVFTGFLGTEHFMAPEIRGYPFTGDHQKASPQAADMWDLGEALFQALTGRRSFDAEGLVKCQRSNGKVVFPADKLRKRHASDLAVLFIIQLMKPDPLERLTPHKPWVTPGSIWVQNIHGLIRRADKRELDLGTLTK